MAVNLAKQISMGNQLIQAMAKLDYPKVSLDIFFFLVSKLTKNHTDSTVYYINSKDLGDAAGIKYNDTEFVEAMEKLRRTIVLKNDKFTLVDGLISSAKVFNGKKTMEVKISSDVVPFLIGLKDDYTLMQLYSLILLKSKYAKRFYLHFYPQKPKGDIVRATVEYKLDEFKRKLGLYDESTKKFEFERISDFKRYVLDPAKKQINQFSDIKIQYRLKKLGREYFFIEFDIENQNNLALIPTCEQTALPPAGEEKSFTEKIDDLAFIERLKDEYCLTQEQAVNVAKGVDRKILLDVLKRVNDANIKKPIDRSKLGGYTLSAIDNQVGSHFLPKKEKKVYKKT